MPKAAVSQTGFSTGEVSPLVYGSTENPRYKRGMAVLANFIPTLQGPIIRRPGTKFMAAVKDATKPPILVPFNFSASQNYMLEVGEGYIRFFANNGAVVTTATSYQVSGGVSGPPLGNSIGNPYSGFPLYATRDTATYQNNEYNLQFSSAIAAGSILELKNPWKWVDLPSLRWVQSGDTIYFVHPQYPLYKLQRQSQTNWIIKPVYIVDGPYLGANAYQSTGDSVGIQMQATSNQPSGVEVTLISKATVNGTSNVGGQIQISTSAAHGLTTGQKVFLTGVGGTVEANNKSLTTGRSYPTAPVSAWTITVNSTTTFVLQGSTYTNAWTSGGTVYPSLFSDDLDALGVKPSPNQNRSLAMVINGVRYWGYIVYSTDAATVVVNPGGTDINNPVAFPANTPSTLWYLGRYSGQGGNFGNSATFTGRGWPSCIAIHQNRLVLGGALATPQVIDGSMVGNFENFAQSVATSLTVQDNSAFSFNLSSEDQNPIRWMKSTAQGLLAATYVAEWTLSPSSASEALTATNVNAVRSSFFGSLAADAVQIGNAVLYVQRAGRKLRELAYSFSAGSFRSVDLSEISEHITLPSLAQVGVQKETQPLVWGRKTDGTLTTLVYNRDDVSLSAGWARHALGGRSDAAGTAPQVLAMSFILEPGQTFDQGWLVVQRWINGAKVCYLEYFSKISDQGIAQEDSVQGDCGGTYDVPLAISTIAKVGASNLVTTAAAHGLTTGNQVRVAGVTGLNTSKTDINFNTTISSAVNGVAFYVVAVSATTLRLVNAAGVDIDFTAASDFVSGGALRKMITTISGASWLAGETVGVLVDGGIHPDVVVSSGGVISLQFAGAKVQFGYRFKSQGRLLRIDAGAADGTSIGKTRRTTRAAMQLFRTGDMAMGTDFNNLIPLQLAQSDQNFADTAFPLFSGIIRDGVESAYDTESQLCFQAESMLPATVQSITSFLEEFDI